MEVLISTSILLLLMGIILIPIYVLWKLHRGKLSHGFMYYIGINIIVTLVLTLILAWWTDTSNRILLSHYGYNINGMNEKEFYGQVQSDDIERVKVLETRVMGIGWHLKAMFAYPVFLIYALLVYLVFTLIRKPNNM